jgi:hypothetical protein
LQTCLQLIPFSLHPQLKTALPNHPPTLPHCSTA